jgi:hypothetical protein
VLGDRLTWIFGSSRSGSTWLLRMLRQLDGVVPIDDPHIGHHLGVWRPIPLAWAGEESPPELRTLPDFKRERRDYFFSDRYRQEWMPALRGLIETRFGAQVREDAAERGIADPIVVVKEPASHVADWLLEIFPGSNMIFLLRDGRDVVDSWLDAYSEDSWAATEGAYPLTTGREREALIRWQASVWLRRTEVVQRAFAAQEPERRVLVRYEQLRMEPRRELRRICALLGVRTPPSRLDEIAEASSYERVPAASRGNGHRIRHAQPGAWRETMTLSEQRLMHRILGPKLAELGYLGSADQQAGDNGDGRADQAEAGEEPLERPPVADALHQ